MRGKMKISEYGIVFLGVALLTFTIFSFLSAPKVDVDSSGNILETTNNEEYFRQQAAAAGSGCGDLRDAANVQHLSHHPSQYAECLKKVEPAFLKQATGKTLNELAG